MSVNAQLESVDSVVRLMADANVECLSTDDSFEHSKESVVTSFHLTDQRPLVDRWHACAMDEH